jgi:lysophospholipase L1-like esterase
MVKFLFLSMAVAVSVRADWAQQEYIGQFHLASAPPRPSQPVLKPGDRLAICGDSITEQKQYSRVIETYLTVCEPDLNISVRQFGWSGETAAGFLRRMTNDVLRFKPTVATTCYGMNDHRYVPYTDDIGSAYRDSMGAVVQAFENNGVKVILGSPGCVGKMPSWVKSASGTVTDLNINLARLRNIDIELSGSLHTAAFADVFSPMIAPQREAQLLYGTNYMVSGKDGVHPGRAGQAIMAYSYLHAMGLGGNLGSIVVDLDSGKARATGGHTVLGFASGEVKIRSSRYPFCAGAGALDDDNTLRSGFQFVPFQAELNRFQLIVRDAKARNYRVTWGPVSAVYTGQQLRAGINLAAEFLQTPFDEAFGKVDQAVAAKEAFETKQIKEQFHGDAGKTDMEGTVKRTEEERDRLVAAVKTAFAPVEHTIGIRLE